MMARARAWAAAIGAALFGGIAFLLSRDTPKTVTSGNDCSEDAFRKRVADVARSQVGKKDLNTYFADAAPQFVGQHPEWCGIFALWCLHQAGLAKEKTWKTALGFILTQPHPMPQTTDPKPGDVAYYEHPYQHQAVVLKNNGDGTTENANGNGSGGVVSISRPAISSATAFYSIANFIAAAQKDCA